MLYITYHTFPHLRYLSSKHLPVTYVSDRALKMAHLSSFKPNHNPLGVDIDIISLLTFSLMFRVTQLVRGGSQSTFDAGNCTLTHDI